MQILAQETHSQDSQTRYDMASRFRRWFNRDNLIIVVLAGILLFVISLPTKESEDTGEQNVLNRSKADSVISEPEIDGADVQGADSEFNGLLEDYEAVQEQKLEELLASMEGVGKVEVMLTFVSSEELVVEKDAPTVRSNTVEKDSAGGNRTISDFETGDTTVYSNVSGDSEPFIVKTLNPRVEGVLVVAQGASNAVVSQNITEAVCALYGVEAHRVKVLDMGSAGVSGSTGASKTTGGSGYTGVSGSAGVSESTGSVDTGGRLGTTRDTVTGLSGD